MPTLTGNKKKSALTYLTSVVAMRMTTSTTHANHNLLCPLCESVSFEDEWLRRVHMAQKHVSGDGSTPFPCPEPGCKRVCTRRSALKSHIDVDHRGDPGQVCEHCNFKFSSKYNLPMHAEKCAPRTPEIRRLYIARHHENVTPAYVSTARVTPTPPQQQKQQKQQQNHPPPPPAQPKPSLMVHPERLPAITAPPVALTATRNVDAVQKALEEPDKTVIYSIGTDFLSVYDLRKLQGTNWMNDVAANCYFQMHAARNTKKGFVRIHAMSSHFYPALIPPTTGKYTFLDYFATANVLSYDWLFVPMHLQDSHWALIAVDVHSRQITYLDSLGCRGAEYLANIKRFLQDSEMRISKLEVATEWNLLDRGKSVPQQQNAYDCGPYMCKLARMWMDVVGSGDPAPATFAFSAEDVAQFRQAMMKEFVVQRVKSS